MKAISFLLFVFSLWSSFAHAQTASLKGYIVDEEGQPVAGSLVEIRETSTAVEANDSGYFFLAVPAQKKLTLRINASGYPEQEKTVIFQVGEERLVKWQLMSTKTVLEGVVIQSRKIKREPGAIEIQSKDALLSPSVAGGVEGLIQTLVGSNNELTSQYSVRGGNYDENLIYINGFEVYRPYLVRNGQQEGLSFINPALMKNIRFYPGTFPAEFGDKISSALDVSYRNPEAFSSSLYLGFLEQGLHFEGRSKNKKIGFLTGFRSKTSRSLLSGQETKGVYLPAAADWQALLKWQIRPSTSLELLSILSATRFDFEPESAQKTASVFSPFYTRSVGLDIYFQGREKDSYHSNLQALTLKHKANPHLSFTWMLGSYRDREKENFDIESAYYFGERNTNPSSANFNQITRPLGVGGNQHYAHNQLKIHRYDLSHRGNYTRHNHSLQWGIGVDLFRLQDRLKEWKLIDSAGYSLPLENNRLSLQNAVDANHQIEFAAWKGFLQEEVSFLQGLMKVNAGVRFHYASLNKELLVSPRVQWSYKPAKNKGPVLYAAWGMYAQPPFYKEMQTPNGLLNTHLKSQKSQQVSVGFDRVFAQAKRPTRITASAYYKSLWDVISYETENVNIRYSGKNDAVAYAVGLEARLFTELVKDAESWLSIGIAKTEEQLKDAYYYDYLNAAGEIITGTAIDSKVADSIRRKQGFVRRPTDRLLTIGLFLQDYLSTNENIKAHLQVIYGSNMSYQIPGSIKYRNGLTIEPYIRVDLGLSARLVGPETRRRRLSPFNPVKSLWIALEAHNLIDRANVISYQFVNDVSGNTFAIPNRLTGRQISLKLLSSF